jgi:hypothetical protein
MGHTHYNEIANDGTTLYIATRSTGQIEEGPVGFSITNLDGEAVSWRFFEGAGETGSLPAVMIVSPSDERLLTGPRLRRSGPHDSLVVRAKLWSDCPLTRVNASIGSSEVAMTQVPGSAVWEAQLSLAGLQEGTHELTVTASDTNLRTSVDRIRVGFGNALASMPRAERDQDNAISAWPEHGLLGTQLGPNKNGRKW